MNESDSTFTELCRLNWYPLFEWAIISSLKIIFEQHHFACGYSCSTKTKKNDFWHTHTIRQLFYSLRSNIHIYRLINILRMIQLIIMSANILAESKVISIARNFIIFVALLLPCLKNRLFPTYLGPFEY